MLQKKNRMEIVTPLTSIGLSFKEAKLEAKFLKRMKSLAYPIMKSFILKVSVGLFLMWVVIFYFHIKCGSKGSSSNDPTFNRRLYWIVIYYPIAIIILNLDWILSRFDKYFKFRGVPSIMMFFYLIADSTVYLYLGQNAYGTLAFIAVIFLYYFCQQITYNWRYTLMGLIAGIVILYIRFIIGGEKIHIGNIVTFVGLGIALLFTSRLFEVSRKREFYQLYTACKREKEIEEVLSSLPLGVIIHEESQRENKNNNQGQSTFRELMPREPDLGDRPDPGPPIVQVKYWNHALKKLLHLGFPVDHHGDHRVMNIMNNRLDGDSSEEIVEEFIQKTISSPPEFEYVRENEIKELGIKKFSITYEQRASIGIIIEDLTLTKRIEREKLSREFQSRLVRTITHEIRTPLNIIYGSTQILSNDEDLTVLQRSHIHTMENGIIFLLAFVESMLNLSKYKESGKIPMKYTSFKMNEVLENLSKLFKLEIERKGLYMIVEIDDQFPFEIYLDKVAITQLLFILIGNALKYTVEGYILLEVEYNWEKQECCLKVKDTGIGMVESEQEHLFELYGNSVSKEFGTGVGLTLCKGLTENMRGTISADSKGEGQGTAFTMRIPVNATSAPSTAEIFLTAEEAVPEDIQGYQMSSIFPMLPNITLPNPNITNSHSHSNLPTSHINTNIHNLPSQEERKHCNCPKILVVEDVPANLFILKEMLKILNLNVDIANNGLQATKMFRASVHRDCCQNYQLVFMDCNMPIMDGYQVYIYIYIYIRLQERLRKWRLKSAG